MQSTIVDSQPRQPLRVLVVSPDYPPPFVGGSLAWIYQLLENCAHECDVLTSAARDGVTDMGRQRVLRSGWLTDSNNPTAWRLALGYAYMAYWTFTRGLLRRYDVILANPGVIGNVVLFWIGRLLQIPVVGTAYSEEITLVLYGRSWKTNVKHRLMKASYRQAEGFVAVCDAVRDMLIDLGVKADVIDVIPPGLTEAKLPSAAAVHRLANGYRILTVGRLIERKGFHDLIDAIDRLRPELPDIHLTIVGDGPMRPQLHDKVRQLGLEQHVTLAGAATDNQLATLYKESDLFVLANRMLPNGDVEGCPVVFAEAAAYGLPVIGGRAGGASSLIDDGKTGLLVKADDIGQLASSISRILTSPELARSMGAAGRAKIVGEHAPQELGRRLTLALERYRRHDERLDVRIQQTRL